MLRAAYFAQELLSTFSTSLGEVALIPGKGGVFKVEIFHQHLLEVHDGLKASGEECEVKRLSLWDRKLEGGFPETKELKRRVRDVIEPGRDLGHVDGKKIKNEDLVNVINKGQDTLREDNLIDREGRRKDTPATNEEGKGEQKACEDCK